MHVLGDAEAVATEAARMLSEASARSIAQRNIFTVALAGGSTPQRTYQLLATAAFRGEVAWDRWQVYFGDERAVPPDDEQSNYRMAADALLSHVPIPEAQIHRMAGEEPDLDAAATAYHDLLAATLSQDGSAPQLDVVHLGLGTNGHTASLFPGTPALTAHDRWAVRGRADYAPFDRITLTYPVLNAARLVLFTVTGAAKHAALLGTAAD
ncbi:MAG: 6-phosphogluconolactonase, partial [Candidatus Dormibacteraeota bacterium]|nr:6-phosphogluconolactonase [Candidatus Dormibacteraeota bacterium]